MTRFQRAREHGDVVRIPFGPFCFYVLNSPSAIRQALVGEVRKLGKGLNFGRAKRLPTSCWTAPMPATRP